MGSLSTNEQRKLAYFHALSKSMTENTQEVYESKYKSSHNIRLNEIWADDISFANTYNDAVNESISNNAVTLNEIVELSMIPGSNGQSYAYISGGTFDSLGNVTSGGQFIRPWIAPTDIPDTISNLPSNGYQVRLFRQDDTEVFLTTGAWAVDYYTGIIHFAEDYTPADLGWGNIKATFFHYSGNYGASGGTSVDAFTSVTFDSGTSELIFNEGEPTETIVDLSSLKVLTGTTSLLSTSNQNMIAENTSFSIPLACLTQLNSNISGSKVFVFVNGVQVRVGNLPTDDCFFSSDGGSTKRLPGQEVNGDRLYWNYDGNNDPVAGYELSINDRVSFLNLTLS